MSATKVINKAMNYDGSVLEIVEVVHDRDMPGIGRVSYAVNHAEGTIGVSTYDEARRIVTSIGDVPVTSHNMYGEAKTVTRAGFGIPGAALASLDEPRKEAETNAAPAANAPVVSDSTDYATTPVAAAYRSVG